VTDAARRHRRRRLVRAERSRVRPDGARRACCR
jgi:hypothetical protein